VRLKAERRVRACWRHYGARAALNRRCSSTCCSGAGRRPTSSALFVGKTLDQRHGAWAQPNLGSMWWYLCLSVVCCVGLVPR